MERSTSATQLFPILTVRDADAAQRFYGDLLGGAISFIFPGPDGKPVYLGLDIGSSHIGLGVDPNAPGWPSPRPISLWVYTDDCDGLIRRLRDAGVTITAEPADQVWGERVARVLDPDGNEVVIGQRSTED
jgi:lactoylglutathione lyase